MYQMVSLLQCGEGGAASKVLRKRRVKDLVAQVESLYLPWNTEGDSRTHPLSSSASSKEVKRTPIVAGASRASGPQQASYPPCE